MDSARVAERAGDVAVVNSSSRYALIALQGPEARAVLRRSPTSTWSHQVLLVRARRSRRRSGHGLPHGLHGRGRLRDLGAAGAGRAGLGRAARRRAARSTSGRAASARATRSASRPACGSTATTWTRTSSVLEAGLGWIRRLEEGRLSRRRARCASRRRPGVDATARGVRDDRPRHRAARIPGRPATASPCGVVTSGTQTPYPEEGHRAGHGARLA